MNFPPLEATFDDNTLVKELAQQGVRHLRIREGQASSYSLDPQTLINSLSSHPDPRFHLALIPLFIQRPDYAAFVPTLAASLGSRAGAVLRQMYTAAVYLQRFWRGVLGLYLGDLPLLPDHFGQSVFGLPEADSYYGEAGLRALAGLFKDQTGYEWLSAYQSTMTLLLDQLRLEVTTQPETRFFSG